MQCDDAEKLISAWIASEINDAELAALAGHLAACQDCRESSVSTFRIDRQLMRTIAPRRSAAERVAARVMRKLSEGELESSKSPRRSDSGGRNWLSLILATAAGFLIGAILFEPWNKPKQQLATRSSPIDSTDAPEPFRPSIARLVTATGPVRIREHGSETWSDVIDPSEFECQAATEISTGPRSLCEIETAGGNVVRMNANSTLVVDTSDRLRILDGQLFCRAGTNGNLEFATSQVESGPADGAPVGIVNCPPNASFMATVVDSDVRIDVATGQLRLNTREGESTIGSGRRARIRSDGVVEPEDVANALLAVGWMDRLLIRGEHNDPDLDTRVNALLAQMGRTKASYLYEKELRGLGEHCVLPLTRYVQSDISKEAGARRLMSMRVIADASPSWNIENLIGLLTDSDPGIRFLAATALLRLTGETHGRSPEGWKTPLSEDDPVLRSWSEWWQARSEGFPALNGNGPQRML